MSIKKPFVNEDFEISFPLIIETLFLPFDLEDIADIFRGISISPNSNIISKSKGKNKVSIIKANDI
jgi:hypothetical protein